MNERILIATDGSEQAEHAINYGLDLAEVLGSTVHVIYVIETKATYILTVDFTDESKKEHEEFGEKTVSDVVKRAKDRGLEAEGVVKSGRVSEKIVEYANQNNVDQIVVGKQGHGAIEKYIGGSAEKIANLADMPVTIVGPKA